MHFHPVARHGAGFRVMMAATGGAILAGLTSSSPASGQKAGDTIKQMQALYNNAASYSGTIKQSQSGTSPQGSYSMTQTFAVKFKKPNLVRVQITTSGTGAASRMNGSKLLAVSDGKTVCQYNEKTNMYVRQPAPPKVPALVGAAQVGLVSFDLGGAKVVSNTTVGGHAAVVIEAILDTSKLSTAQRAQALKQLKPVSLTIDKGSHALLHVHITSGPTPVDVDLSGQSFNVPLSASEFNFTPPPGAKLITPQTGQPGPGGAPPSLPGGAPHR